MKGNFTGIAEKVKKNKLKDKKKTKY